MTPILALLAALPLLSAPQNQERTDGGLRVAATRSTDSGAAPLAGLSLRLVRIADTTQRVLLSTRADGQALAVAPAGDYRLRSLTPTPLGATTVAWDVPVTILNDRVTRIELTDRNAVPWDTLTQPRGDELVWLTRSRRGTVRLIAGVTKGTGILLDTLGGLVVVTTTFVGNMRVVAMTGPGSAVATQEVARDSSAGLALLRLPAGACADCAPLRLADHTRTRPGDAVVVLARPAHQEPEVVTGRVTAVGADTLATTVGPTPQLTGGALVDSGGAVLAVLACWCGQSAAGTEELRRVIPISRLAPLLAHATGVVATAAQLPADPLAVTPEPSPAMNQLRTLADTATSKAYERFVGQDAGNFRVSLVTPAYLLARLREAQQRLANMTEWQVLAEEQRVSRVIGYGQDWISAFGELAVPAVAIDVTPDAGQTGGLLRRALLPGANANIRFKADLERVEIIRNGVAYEPIAGARLPVRVSFDIVGPGGGKAKMHDSTTWGYYLLPPEVLMPDSTGAPPSIVLKLFDARRRGGLTVYELRADVVARAWNDFAPYYRAARPDVPFRTAFPGKFRSRLREVRGR